ncbi:MAG: helix-turn-helix domain-containing protein [Betaproteobacteria bacterium]|nr:helix-turn-helix domain-containing protein [Betaproteobacteria bacterium]
MTMKQYDTQETRYGDGDFLTTQEVAKALQLSKATLDGWRCKGTTGPKFTKLGKRLVRYKWADVRQWLEKQGRQ